MEGQLDILQLLIDSSLVVKLVLILLIACSVYSWSIIIKKRGQLKACVNQDNEMKEKLTSVDSTDQVNSLTMDFPNSNLSLMLKNGLSEYETLKNKVPNIRDHFGHFGFGSIERALKLGAQSGTGKLNNQLSMLASIGSVSPFIGLFGTVWGIVNSISGMSSGGSSLEAVAPGIAEALVATAVGLAAAIPAVWFYNKFQNEISIIETNLQSAGEEFLNLIERDIY